MPKISSTSSSKGRAIALAAAALLAMPNAWLAWHAPRILNGEALWQPIYLEDRLAALPHPERVQVLVLGNSHTMGSMRPQQVAAALGVPDGAVVSLALPGASAWEMRLLVERYAARFPKVTRVLCGLDPYLLGLDLTPRARYLTRTNLWERWDYSQRIPALEAKCRVLAGWFFPLGDFNVSLRTLATTDAGRLLHQAVTLERQPLKGRDYPAVHYPWGVPLVYDFDTPDTLAALRQEARDAQFVSDHAYRFLGAPSDLPRGFADLDRLLAVLKARYPQVHLAESPFASALETEIAGHYAARRQLYRTKVDALARRYGMTVLPAPRDLTDADYYDLNHLTRPGGQKYVTWLAKAIGGS